MAKELQQYAVSCWHASESESAAMWERYASRGFGLAIRSTVGSLLQSIAEPSRQTWFGLMKYVDYQEELPPAPKPQALFYKRVSYAHENEFRIVAQLNQIEIDSIDSYLSHCSTQWVLIETPESDPTILPASVAIKGNLSALYAPVDLDRLVYAIYLGPQVDRWVFSEVEEVLQKFGLSKRVLYSGLELRPPVNLGRVRLRAERKKPSD